MKQNYLHDQRGVAMLLELVLVAAVLGLVGVAIYQSGHHNTPAALAGAGVLETDAAGLAASAAAAVVQDSTSDAALSESADAAAGEVTSADTDVESLGGTLDANAF